MTSQSNVLSGLRPRDVADYGFARARDIAFDAVQTLWRRRRQEGMQQANIATAIGRDRAWVSRNLRAPGNWTLRTIGELVEALGGELEIVVHAKEDLPEQPTNYSAYAGYEPPNQPSAQAPQYGRQVIGHVPAGFAGRPVLR